MADPAYFIGLISGTSLDAIDCALVSFDDDQPILHSSLALPYPAGLRQQLLDLCQQPAVSLASFGEVFRSAMVSGFVFKDISAWGSSGIA